MSDGVHRDEKGEKLRVCPSCRMQISVLAAKCRWCGEEVGKPKDEARTLSVHDLGGESIQHRAPSGSVMEALEAFRVEETFATSEAPQLGGPSLDLDFGGGGSARSSGTSAFASARTSKPAKPAKSKVPLIAGIVAAIALVAVLAIVAPKLIGGLGGQNANANLPTYTNRAPGILASGGPAIDALQAAVEAIGHENSEKNRAIADEAVAALDKEVRDLLRRVPFNMENLHSASSLANRGADLYPTEVTRALVAEVQDDNRAYKIVLLNLDGATDSATFILNDAAGSRATVQPGGMLLDRFRVERVLAGTRMVSLSDTKRANRPVVFEAGGTPRAPN